MSYTLQDNKIELWSRYDEVMHTRDIEEAMALAYLFEDIHDYETADDLRHLANKWDNEDWAYDRANDQTC